MSKNTMRRLHALVNNFRSMLCLVQTPKRHTEQEFNKLTELHLVSSCNTISPVTRCALETNVSCVFTSRLVHPSSPSRAQARAVVVVPARHAFALAALHPLLVDVVIDALEI